MKMPSKRLQDISQQILMQILYWALQVILFIVLFTYSNPLWNYLSVSGDAIFAVLWALIHCITFALHRLTKTDPGFLPIDNDEAPVISDINSSCAICNTKKPLRSRHCNTCNRCVRKYDHHCFWLGTCVGEKNQRVFLMFLASQTVCLFWDLSLTMKGYSTSVKTKSEESKGCWVVTSILCFLGLLFVGSLLAMHTYFAVTNWTSWEKFRGHKVWYLRGHRRDKSPFDLGVWRNISEVFWQKNYPVDWTIIGLTFEPTIPTTPPDEISICF